MLPDAPSICRLHLDYMKWADDLMMGMVRGADPAVWERDCGVSFRSIAGTVQHIYRAERVWYRRVHGENTLNISAVETPSIAELADLWPAHHAEWRHWAAELPAEAWFVNILTRNSQGQEARLPQWQIVLHLVNHGSYHRGQVTSLVKQAGFPVVSSDLGAYYRVLAAQSVPA